MTFETFLALAIMTYGPLGFHVIHPEFSMCDRLPQKLMVSKTVEIQFFSGGRLQIFLRSGLKFLRSTHLWVPERTQRQGVGGGVGWGGVFYFPRGKGCPALQRS